VAYYGMLKGIQSRVSELYCPLLYHQAGADTLTPADEVEQFRQTAEAHGKLVEIRRYPGSAHGFSNEMRKDVFHSDSAQQAWETTLAFLAEHLRS
jgi:carboxymethylenebutenolidase